VIVGVLALVSITAIVQEDRSEISIPGTGLFTKDRAGNAPWSVIHPLSEEDSAAVAAL
jgi:hypothetical protein